MTPDIFEPRHKEISHHVVSGILNSGIIQTVGVLCQFGSVIFLSRMLTPGDFGIFAMATPIFGFVMMFQNMGLSLATVQKPNLRHEEVNAFFWLNIAAGAILALMLLAISPVAGWYYGDPRVTPLTAAFALMVMVNSVGNQHGALLQRRMEFKTSAYLGALGGISGLGVSIIWALLFKSYWALYFGLMAGTAVPVIGVWIAVPWRPTRPAYVGGIGDMLKFGAALTSVSVSGFISRNLDNVLIGHRWGDQILGYYDRAYKLLLFPLQKVIDPVSTTMVPVLSRVADEPARYCSIFQRTLAQIALVTWPGIVWAIVLADVLVPVLLGKVWMNSIDIFRPLAMAGILQVLNGAFGWLFITQRRSGEFARWGVFSASTSVLAFLIGLPYGALGVATAYAISEYCRTPIFWWYATRRGPVPLWETVRLILPQAIGGAIAFCALLGLRHIMLAAYPILLMICGLILSYGVVALVMMLFAEGRETLTQSIKFIHRVLLHITMRSNSPVP